MDPATGVVIRNAIPFGVHGKMRVAAENAIGAAQLGVGQRTGSDFRREPQPRSVEPVERPRKPASLGLDLLQVQVYGSANLAQERIVDSKAVELVSVDGQMPLAREFPTVFPIHLDPHQVRHHPRKSLVMIAFHPYHFDLAFGIGELANVGKKMPMLLL